MFWMLLFRLNHTTKESEPKASGNHVVADTNERIQSQAHDDADNANIFSEYHVALLACAIFAFMQKRISTHCSV